MKGKKEIIMEKKSQRVKERRGRMEEKGIIEEWR